jgi:hypothetical protein
MKGREDSRPMLLSAMMCLLIPRPYAGSTHRVWVCRRVWEIGRTEIEHVQGIAQDLRDSGFGYFLVITAEMWAYVHSPPGVSFMLYLVHNDIVSIISRSCFKYVIPSGETRFACQAMVYSGISIRTKLCSRNRVEPFELLLGVIADLRHPQMEIE